MTKWLKKLRKWLIWIGIIIIFMTFFSLLNYWGVSFNITKYILLIFVGLFFWHAGYNEGKKRDNKGYLAGLKTSSILIGIFIISNLIFFNYPFLLRRVVYYFILMLIGVLGSIIGINKKTMD